MSTSNRERQVAEITLLSTMYPTEFTWRTSPPPDLARLDFPDPNFALTLHPSYTLELSLPSTYPSDSKPNTYVSCGPDVSTYLRKQSRAALESIVSEQESGIEILDLIVTSFNDALSAFTNAETHISGSEDKYQHASRTDDPTIKRVVIWLHHLLSTTKRRNIVKWSAELHLTGFSRPGYPGSIFVEGEGDQVDEFVTRLKALRWQGLQVRAEETGMQRALAVEDGWKEVEGLGDIAEALKKHQAAGLYLEGMKIIGG